MAGIDYEWLGFEGFHHTKECYDIKLTDHLKFDVYKMTASLMYDGKYVASLNDYFDETKKLLSDHNIEVGRSIMYDHDYRVRDWESDDELKYNQDIIHDMRMYSCNQFNIFIVHDKTIRCTVYYINTTDKFYVGAFGYGHYDNPTLHWMNRGLSKTSESVLKKEMIYDLKSKLPEYLDEFMRVDETNEDRFFIHDRSFTYRKSMNLLRKFRSMSDSCNEKFE